MLNVFIENLGKYNEGEIVGRWLELPCSDDELQSALEEIGIGSPRFDGGVYEEWFVADWDCDIPFLKYSEYPNLGEWNEVAEWFDGASERDKALVTFLLDDDMSRTFDEAVEICRSGNAYFIGGIESAYEIGEYFAGEFGLLDDVGEEVEKSERIKPTSNLTNPTSYFTYPKVLRLQELRAIVCRQRDSDYR